MSIHDGHRQRLKQRFLEEGLESFTDIQVLELLLFFSVPRQDTNPIAHALLDHFGSLYQVLEAPVEELRKVKGVGEQSALLLSLMNDVARYYQVDRTMREKILPTVQACGEYLVPFFFGRNVETVFLLCLDAKCKVLCCKEVGQGSVNSAGISVRKIVETCHPPHRGSGAQPPQRHRGALQRGRADHMPGGHGLERGGNSAGRPYCGGGRGLCLHGAVGLPAG